jgi:hypothetical protein
LTEVVFYFTLVLGIIPLAILLRKKQTRHTFITPFLWLTLFASFYELVCTDIFLLPSALWFTAYLLLEFIAFWYYFYNILHKSYYLLFLGCLVTYLIFFACIMSGWKSSTSYNTDAYLSIYEVLFVYIFAVLWFRREGVKSRGLVLLNIDFYFVSGIILYLSGTLFLFLMSNVLFTTQIIKFESYWQINVFFNIILRIFLIIGICKMRRQK